jgi:EpsI family protein
MISNRAFLSSFYILLLALVLVLALSRRTNPVVVQTNLENIPMVIDGYIATDYKFSDSVYKELNADKYVSRHYKSQDGSQIDLYIGYFGTAKGGRTGHNPYACLPGAGLAIVDTGKVYLKKPGGGMVPVNYIRAVKDGINTLMLHWYQTAGNRVVATGFEQNIQRFVDKVLYNRNNGAVVQVNAYVFETDVPMAKQKLERFAEAMIKILPNYWPVEK